MRRPRRALLDPGQRPGDAVFWSAAGLLPDLTLHPGSGRAVPGPCGMVDSPAWGEAPDAQQLRGSTSKKKGGRFLLPEAGDVARASWSCV